MGRMPTDMPLMVRGVSKCLCLLMLSTAVVGLSVQGVALHVCSEVCSDGSCAPCHYDTQVNQSSQGSSGQGNNDLKTTHTMTLTLSMSSPGHEQAVSRSSRQASSPESPPSDRTQPTMDDLLTSLGIHPSHDTKQPSDKSSTHSGAEKPLTSPPASASINVGDFPASPHSPGEFTFGFLGTSGFHDISTPPETNNHVSVMDSRPTPNTSPNPGAEEGTGWGEFLNTPPASHPKTETDSAPNEKLERLETTTEDTHREPGSSPRSVSAKTESSVERARVTGSLVLPDDAKKNLNLNIGPLNNVGPPQPDPSAGAAAWPPAEESSTPGQAVTGSRSSSASPRDVEGSGGTTGGGEEEGEEEEGGRGGEEKGVEGDDDAQLHGIQIILLVAPCVGALLSVIGAVCVVRTAAANCCRRQKQMKEGSHQQHQMNRTQPPSNRRRTTHPGSERDIERNSRRSH